MGLFKKKIKPIGEIVLLDSEGNETEVFDINEEPVVETSTEIVIEETVLADSSMVLLENGVRFKKLRDAHSDLSDEEFENMICDKFETTLIDSGEELSTEIIEEQQDLIEILTDDSVTATLVDAATKIEVEKLDRIAKANEEAKKKYEKSRGE